MATAREKNGRWYYRITISSKGKNKYLERGSFLSKDEALAIINDWEINPPCGGVVEDVDWEERPRLPDINEADVTDEFCGTYSDLIDMVLSICELSNIKAYNVVSDDGRLLRYTFEVVE